MSEKTIPVNYEDKGIAVQETTRENTRYFAPPVDIYEEEGKLVVIADLPGADKETVNVDVENGILTLQAKSKPNGKHETVYTEYEMMNYFRQFELSETVDVQKISAELKNGVLYINLPKVPKAMPRKIDIKSN